MLRYIRSTLFPRIPFHRHRASSRAPLSSQPLQCSGSFLSCVLYMDFSFASALNAAESAYRFAGNRRRFFVGDICSAWSSVAVVRQRKECCEIAAQDT